MLSDVYVLIFIINSCIPRRLPGGGGHCDLDSVDVLAVTVLRAQGFLGSAFIWWTDISIRLGITRIGR